MLEKSNIKGKIENSVTLGGYATLRKEVVVMKKYIIRVIILVIVILVTFTTKVK